MSTVEIKGLQELGASLGKFGDKIATHYLHVATYAAAELLRKAVVARAPVSMAGSHGNPPGMLRDSLVVIRRRGAPLTSQYSVGVRKIKLKYALNKLNKRLKRAGLAYFNDDAAFYWRFIEFKTKHAKAHPFMGPAFEQNKFAAMEKFSQVFAAGVEKATQESR